MSYGSVTGGTELLTAIKLPGGGSMCQKSLSIWRGARAIPPRHRYSTVSMRGVRRATRFIENVLKR